MRAIPIIRIPFSEEDIRALQEDWAEVLGSNFLTLGTFTRRFEELFCGFTGARYAASVSSGTAALEVIIRALGLEGRSIIVPTNTFLASALAVMHSGNRVVFADSDPATMGLDPEDVARRIDKNTAAIMTVHIGGVISPAIEALRALCARRNLHLIEDCAHAHGSSLEGRHAGRFGIAGAFSFFPTKTLTTGEGGMVITDDEDLHKKILMLRNQGKNPALGGKISELGYNWRINEFTAVVGVQQMRRVTEILADRRRIAGFYDTALKNVSGLRPLALPPRMESSYYKYIAFLDPAYERSAVKRLMKEKHGVSLPGEVYAELCHDEPLWQQRTYCGAQRNGDGAVRCLRWPGCGCGTRQQEFPGAAWLSRHHLCLPMYPGLTEDDLEYVVESLERALREHDSARAVGKVSKGRAER